mmetsp:Transcript_4474/g.5648  ORF Transcript_4474/g.5648 Transcript_4474/m.5648 type:complete len:104 (+) Transcript_4474:1-312(+)
MVLGSIPRQEMSVTFKLLMHPLAASLSITCLEAWMDLVTMVVSMGLSVDLSVKEYMRRFDYLCLCVFDCIYAKTPKRNEIALKNLTPYSLINYVKYQRLWFGL